MTNPENKMEMLVCVTWKDSAGLKLADATTLAKLPEALAAIGIDGGEVIGVHTLEHIPSTQRH